jgi:hypothetical protein
MANLRIIHSNVADLAVITDGTSDASNTATGFSIKNVQNTKKTSVHRSVSNIVNYELKWVGNPQKISAIALPATNLLDGASISVKLYTGANDTNTRADSGTLTAAKDRTILIPNNGTYNSNVFAYNGATKTSVWFNAEYLVEKVIISVVSSAPVDCARIICGTYWESSRQVNNGITLGVNDTSVITTSRAGDVYADRRPIQETMQFQLQYLSETDRRKLQQIMNAYGSNGLLFACVFPDNTNPEITQAYSIYGRSQSNSLEYALFSLYNSSMTIDSW